MPKEEEKIIVVERVGGIVLWRASRLSEGINHGLLALYMREETQTLIEIYHKSHQANLMAFMVSGRTVRVLAQLNGGTTPR